MCDEEKGCCRGGFVVDGKPPDWVTFRECDDQVDICCDRLQVRGGCAALISDVVWSASWTTRTASGGVALVGPKVVAPTHMSSGSVSRFAADRDDVVAGYSVALRPSRGRADRLVLAAVVEADADRTWDSAERRMAHVAGIQTSEAQPVAAAEWKQADVDNARHPREAVKSSRPKSSRPRASTVTPGPQAERGR